MVKTASYLVAHILFNCH